ncbi:MAG: hypothetical protein QOJ73_5641 [Streptosporangiaceae bacterium]|jgi:uncharacterized protein YxjI|nr:hypothetical protein [Streptosporangiaceae bacterium]
MARYVLIRELWSLSDAFTVRESESDRECFRVRGKALGVGDKLSLEDPGGSELAFIRQGLHLGVQGLCYEISQGGQLAARVNLSPRLRQHLLIETPDPGSFAADGDIVGMDYQISRDGRQAANVSTRWTPDDRFYSVDVADGQDPVFILALAVTIETIHQEQDG